MILRVAIVRMARVMLGKLFSASASVALLLALAACGGGGDDAPPPAPPPPGLQPTLASIQANVFTPSCAYLSGCHAGPTAQFGLRLDPGFSWAALVNVVSPQDMTRIRVVPMDSSGSLLIQKLEGTAMLGGQMPADGPPFLQQATINVIRQWIDDGALP
jgi:hypothetical protein